MENNIPFEDLTIIASHDTDTVIRRESSAGGIFSALARNVLEDEGVVYGAAFDEKWSVSHCRIDNIDCLRRLRGSKYVYSSIGNTIREAETDLKAGRKVLFSGTPCQIGSARKILGKNSLLLLVEVVCHGAPSPNYWERYLDELCERRKKSRSQIIDIDFRDKCTGWKDYSFTIKYADGSKYSKRHDDNLYMRAFLKNLTLREPCFRCPFKLPHGSRADLTIGDFWGISQLAPEIDNDLGTTIIIINTRAGKDAAAGLPVYKQLSFNDIARCNPAIIRSPSLPQMRVNFLSETKKKSSLIKVMKHYAGRHWGESIYLHLARLKYKLFH